MYTLRRWWDRHWSQVVLVSLIASAAWLAKATQGAAIFELYQLVTSPFQSDTTKQEQLTDARVLELQARLGEIESQNQKLKQLLGFQSQQKGTGIAAPIIGRSADHWWQQVTLGRGSQAGIKTDYVVTAPGGLVGRVTSVTPHTSRVLLISDPSSGVGVMIGRSRYMGIMRGRSNNKAVMQFFEKTGDVRKGDFVMTSSISHLFPSGLPVGQVESVDLSKNPAPEATIKLSAPMNSLEWVVVYPTHTNPE
ncbi:MAG TPA: rod shape-determining protein MreC [Cyanobacteria bacterium UBA11372]|nr:rod shape-determining protein MreC [Cyanobacteria bacterium UBA11372]